MAGLTQECIEYVYRMAKRFMKGQGAHVSIGGSGAFKPREFLVREIPESADITDVSTSAMGRSGARGCYRQTFNVAVECWAQSRDLLEASALVNSWVDLLKSHVAADKTLGGLCVHARPYDSGGGTSLDTASKLFTAARSCGVTVNADIDPASDIASQEKETETWQ